MNKRPGGDRSARGRDGGRRRPPKRHGPGRRTPPPEATGNERRYWQELLAVEAELTLHLEQGRTIRGRLVETQEHAVGIAADDTEIQLVRKAEIRFIEGP